MEDWASALKRGDSQAAWDLFVDRYRRLIFAAIRHYARDYDDVMDVFVWVCESLQADNFRRLRASFERDVHRGKFSTWLVMVVRHLTVDWFRQKQGRRRLSTLADTRPPIQQRIFTLVFLERRTHLEAYEMLRSQEQPELDFGVFLAELRATYRATTVGRHGQILRELGTQPWPDELVLDQPEENTERREVLEAAMQLLPATDRLAVRLYVQEQLPAERVAKVLGLPNAKAVYNRVYRALAALRTNLQQAGIAREDL